MKKLYRYLWNFVEQSLNTIQCSFVIKIAFDINEPFVP